MLKTLLKNAVHLPKELNVGVSEAIMRPIIIYYSYHVKGNRKEAEYLQI